jgi:hypothetical protein
MLITEYIRRMDIRTNTLFSINAEGKGLFIEDGNAYTREEFYRKYPLPLDLAHKRDNADKSKKWLQVD